MRFVGILWEDEGRDTNYQEHRRTAPAGIGLLNFTQLAVAAQLVTPPMMRRVIIEDQDVQRRCLPRLRNWAP